MVEHARQLQFGVFASEQMHPVVEQQDVLSPTHIIPQKARIIVPTKRGPTTVSARTETEATVLVNEKFDGEQAYLIHANLTVWYGQKHAEWTIPAGKIIGVYPKQAVKITRNGEK